MKWLNETFLFVVKAKNNYLLASGLLCKTWPYLLLTFHHLPCCVSGAFHGICLRTAETESISLHAEVVIRIMPLSEWWLVSSSAHRGPFSCRRFASGYHGHRYLSSSSLVDLLNLVSFVLYLVADPWRWLPLHCCLKLPFWCSLLLGSFLAAVRRESVNFIQLIVT